ncbi:MAG: hypothetical protein IKL65_04600 [Bacilli bacterium]|nr:hypothetical protein [Bacilli bacterium]
MKCNRCGKEIDELEIFCDDCKRHLKNFSSRREVKELEQLIENQKKFDDLENTKELVNLDKLVEEKLEKEEKVELRTKVIEVNNIVESNKEDAIENNEKPKKNKKKLIISISIISIILIGIIILLIILLGKDKPEENEKTVIDYEKVINTYGDKITKISNDYITKNEDVPTWQYILENVDYNRYEVECGIHNIYKDGSIYLAGCKVDGKKIKHTYGEEKEEIKEGKKISVYKLDYDGFIVYTGVNENSSTIAGTITCKTEECTYISAYDKYVLIEEESEYYLYDYTTDSLNFGPFKLTNEYDVLVHNNILYGIIYNENDLNNIYNVQTGKTLKNVKGFLLPGEMDFDPTIMYKYNYAIFVNNDKNEFINLKTGNVSYSIKESIVSFIEKNKIVYITTLTPNNKYKIYNSNGKALFDGKEYINFIMNDNEFLVSTETNFKVYDKNLNIKVSSKNYDKVLGLYQDFVVATKGNNLILLSTKDKEYITFENVWDDSTNIFHYNLTRKSNNKISVIIEDKKMPIAGSSRGIEYYYDIKTKESGFIENTIIQ